jgi:hypothetical protein
MIWAASAAKLGHRWKIGNGNKVKFYEDNWLGPSILAIQYREVYILVNEKAQSCVMAPTSNALLEDRC